MTELEVEDVLNPRTAWVDDSCYRVNRKSTQVKKKYQGANLPQPYTDNEEIMECNELCDYDIEVTENGRFKTSIRLPQTFFAFIIGTKGSRRKKLEEETKTDISIPRGTRNNNITITGTSERNVILARQRLEMIGFDLRNRQDKTHFISFPLVSKEIKENFTRFKEMVLQEGHIDGLDESIFKNVDKIHLTIGCPVVLLDDYEKDEASKILQQWKNEVLPNIKYTSPLKIKMKGLDYMNDDPSHVHVLYAKVQIEGNEELLQDISDNIVDFYHKKGIMKKEREHVKLHATLINTRYRKDNNDDEASGSKSRNRKFKKKIAFDARPIIAKYANFDFGEQTLDTIHLSQRQTVDETGYYEPIYTICL